MVVHSQRPGHVGFSEDASPGYEADPTRIGRVLVVAVPGPGQRSLLLMFAGGDVDGQAASAFEAALNERAVQLGLALGLVMAAHRARRAHAIAGALLETIRQPALVLGPATEVLASNQAAERLMDAGASLTRGHEGRLRLSPPALSHMLAAEVQELCAGRADTQHIRRIAIPSPAGVPRRYFNLRRLGAGPAALETNAVLAVVWSEGDSCGIAPETVASAFGLTRAEAELAVALADGQTVKGYASARNLGVSTVRWHLHNALQKTGAATQLDMVRAVLSLL